MHAHESDAYCLRPGKMGYRYLLGGSSGRRFKSCQPDAGQRMFLPLATTPQIGFDPNSYPTQELECVRGEAPGKLRGISTTAA